jgi:tetratricopeptide (TPR) repeat protein
MKPLNQHQGFAMKTKKIIGRKDFKPENEKAVLPDNVRCYFDKIRDSKKFREDLPFHPEIEYSPGSAADFQNYFPEISSLILGNDPLDTKPIYWQLRYLLEKSSKELLVNNTRQAQLYAQQALSLTENYQMGDLYYFRACSGMAQACQNTSVSQTIKWLDRAIAAHPVKNPLAYIQDDGWNRVYFRRGFLKLAEKNFEEAKNDLTESLLIAGSGEPFRGDTLQALGLLASQENIYTDAVLYFKRAIEEYTLEGEKAFQTYSYPEVLKALGSAQLDSEDFLTAAETFSQIISRNSETWGAYRKLSSVLFLLGHSDLSHKVLEISKAKYCSRPEVILAEVSTVLGINQAQPAQTMSTQPQGRPPRYFH